MEEKNTEEKNTAEQNTAEQNKNLENMEEKGLQVTVLFFGIARQMVQRDTMPVSLASNASLSLLKDVLYRRYPDLAQFDCFLFAVNECYQKENFLLQEGDVVALIPPVSGG